MKLSLIVNKIVKQNVSIKYMIYTV